MASRPDRAASAAASETIFAERLDGARAIADTILYEGYLLYPYRRSSAKNQVRWQFGVLAPREWIEHNAIPDPGAAGSAESWFQQVDAPVEAPLSSTVHIRLRFLQLRRRQAYIHGANGVREPVDRLDVRDGVELTFDEALPREFDTTFDIGDLLAGARTVPVTLPGSSSVAARPDVLAGPAGEVERCCWPLEARLIVSARRPSSPFPLVIIRVRVENTARAEDPAGPRDVALRRSLIATHLVLAIDDGRFLSQLDPPSWAAPAVADCVNRHVFPVLAGPEGGDSVLLCSPIIMYDHVQIAPESPGDLNDATEIDEILSLRTMTLTDAEKLEARASDPRAAAIVDRVDAMPPELLAKLHGAIRDLQPSGANDDEPPWWDPRAEAAVDPDTDTIVVGGQVIGRGARVCLRPRGHGTDAHDMFLAGRSGVVHAVLRDVDGSTRVAVTVDDDPAAELHEWYGRFFHFSPDEIEPIGGGQ
jgi:hypothetical protein